MLDDVQTLAAAVKNNTAHMLVLWEAVYRLIHLWAYRYTLQSHEQGSRLLDTDDLIQAGYLALVDAVEGFNPERGMTFPGYLSYHVRRRFAEVVGIRGTKRRPELYATSLDAPLTTEDEGFALGDTIADHDAAFEDDVIDRTAISQDAAALMIEVNKLPHEQQQALLLTSRDNLTVKEAAAVMDMTTAKVLHRKQTAARRVRQTKAGRVIEQDYRLRHVTLTEFRHTWTSAVERSVILRIDGSLVDDIPQGGICHD